MAQRTCSIEGCNKPHRAKGYCGSHYNQQLAPDRHLTIRTCVECGRTYTTTRTNGRYCSLWCRDAEGRRRKALVGPVPAHAPRKTPPTIPLPSPRQWVAGPCAWCGTPFVAQTWAGAAEPRYCSKVCGTRATDRRHKTTRREYLVGSKWIDPRTRYTIYTRDRWTCQLCGDPVDKALPYNHDWAASLDHIVPRSLGGSHEPQNLRLAHRWCNAVRRESDPSELFKADSTASSKG